MNRIRHPLGFLGLAYPTTALSAANVFGPANGPGSVAPSALSGGSTSRASLGFAELDERIVTAFPGLLFVHAPTVTHDALGAHLARRIKVGGVCIAAITGGAESLTVPVAREVASQLGVAVLPTELLACTTALTQAALGVAAGRRGGLVLTLPPAGSWDRAVVVALAQSLAGSMVVVLVAAPEEAVLEGAQVFEVERELSAQARLRWLGAIAEEAQDDLQESTLDGLAQWWAKARQLPADGAPSLAGLSSAARSVLECLTLVGRSLPAPALAAVSAGHDAAVEELVAAGAVLRSGPMGTVLTLAGWAQGGLDPAGRPSAERARVAARVLLGPGTDPDPWTYVRAAELLLAADETDEADAVVTKALRGIEDPKVASELGARWFAVVAPIEGLAGLTLRIRGAQRALAMGEAAIAQRWCEAAALRAPNDPTVALLTGRAFIQLGDLVAARVALQRALGFVHDGDDDVRARALAELAEVAYLAGSLEESQARASEAMASSRSTNSRLAARNTLGKILLAEGKWDHADAHFAEDALHAGAAHDGTAELRARLNRGIALLSKGMLDDARAIMERVLEDGGRHGEDRARAHAYSNLGVIAYRQRDYGAALAHWDATTRFPQALRGRVATALTIGNLAELRLRLGLVEHAEHALAFGRRLLVGSGSPARSSHFRRVAAQIALARRNTEVARREIEAAIVDAELSGDRDVIDAAYVVAVRIALEDGDLPRVATTIAHAEKHATSVTTKAEIAILEAHHLRALGKPAIDAATAALAMARAANDEDLLTEIHLLLATAHRDAGNLQLAEAHIARAVAVRDHVAASLPADIRPAYLAKPEFQLLARLASTLSRSQEDLVAEDEAPRTQRTFVRDPGVAPREIIGDDAQIRALNVAIRKVARSNSTVLIRGESGTGKELVAEALHRASDCASGPLVTVNCAALVETLLLSELFGHEKGAFTGASARRRGRFELAEGGTLFLDEIGDISARTQVALLRVLQEKTFERVGGTQSIRANVRVVCATHRDLRAMVERGEFREDLYYRLRGITLEVPALRARLGDLPKIAEHLLARIADERNEEPKSLSQDAVELLCRHRWPGNIRELENVLRAASLFAETRIIGASDLIDNVDDLRVLAQAGPAPQGAPVLRPSLIPPPPSVSLPVVPGDGDEEVASELPEGESGATAVAYAHVRQGTVSLSDMKRQIERDCIARALAETKGNITRAAALLGMKRPRLSQLVKQYGLTASSEGSQ